MTRKAEERRDTDEPITSVSESGKDIPTQSTPTRWLPLLLVCVKRQSKINKKRWFPFFASHPKD
jgi:hypothetical protein